MKAVCLLVCFALPALGSIFPRRPYPSMDGLAADADYVDAYLQEQQNRLQQQEYQYQQEQRQRYKNQHQEYKPRQWNAEEEYQQKRRQLKDEYEQYQKENMQRFAEPSDSASQENIPALTGRQYDQEYAIPRFADLNTPAVAYRMNEVPAVYADAVAWRGLEMVDSAVFPVNEKDIERIFHAAQRSTKHIEPKNQLKLHEAVVAAQTDSEDAHLNATEMLKKHQYPVEEHTIKTEDGYYLTLFRIPPKQQSEDKPRKVVFLMHGLLGSADDWLLMGPGKSLAYQLSDAGYDVYLGNARGNKYTHHASKHRAQPDFWQYSNDEIALYDLPAMIDYVLKVSKQEKIYYVGHSQGTTAFFALAAARPEYNEKIAMMFALSPMVYMDKVRSPLIRMIAPSSPFYERLRNQLGNGEFAPQKEVVHTIGGHMCEKEIGCEKMCSNMYLVMAGMNVENLDPAKIPSIMGHLPAGGSIKQMQQYGQSVDSQEFRMYDYGAQMNKRVYGQSEPPKYEMEKVTTPVVLYYSQHDWMAHPANVERLAKELPHATAHKIPTDYFSHTDFQYSKQAPEVVNKNLIETIQRQSDKQQQH